MKTRVITTIETRAQVEQITVEVPGFCRMIGSTLPAKPTRKPDSEH